MAFLMKQSPTHYSPGYAKIKLASRYAGVSERTFRKWMKEGLKYIRLPSGTILIRYSAIDEWLCSHEVQGDEVDKIVNEIEKDLMR